MVFGTIMGAIFGSDIFGSDLCSFLARLIFTLYSFDLVHTWSNAKKCKHNLRKLPNVKFALARTYFPFVNKKVENQKLRQHS